MSEDDKKPTGRFRSSSFAIALVGSLLLFAAQPPLGWSLLAWLAPIPWLWLATRPQLTGRRPYVQIWLATMVYWMLVLHWVRLAHPATIVGLFFMAAYLALYVPLFVALVRQGHRALRVPLWIVAPIVWTGSEYAQGHLLSGFLLGTLGQTQVDWPALIQISDLGGAYMVSLLVMLVASCLFEIARPLTLPQIDRHWSRAALPACVFACAFTSTLWYGHQQLTRTTNNQPTRHIALVQGSHRAVWTHDPGRDKRVMATYIQLSRAAVAEARRKGKPIDLLVWPEGMFRTLLFSYDPGFTWAQPSDASPKTVASYGRDDLTELVRQLGVPILVGIDREHARSSGEFDGYNSVAAVGRTGKLIGTYDKTHLVMFGEYVPGASWWPGIYNYFPIGGVTPGDGPRSFLIGGVRYMPTICFETVLPHVVRRQVAQLAEAGERPDLLVNMTNGSWFNDSSELVMHLTCTRFRAIECRTPVVVAANGGLSAHIDRNGQLLAVSQPMTEETLLVEVQPGADESFYVRHGDLLAGGCLIATALLAIIGMVKSRSCC